MSINFEKATEPVEEEVKESPYKTERSESLSRIRAAGFTQRELIDAYMTLEYELSVSSQLSIGFTEWLGYRTIAYPDDLFLKAKLLWDFQPTLVILTGTFLGGGGLWLATTMDTYGVGKVLTIDIEPFNRGFPVHPRIRYLCGKSSVDEGVLAEVRQEVEFRASGKLDNVLVILDSDHSAEHVTKELDAYAEFVNPGSYLIVEDTNLDGRPIIQQRNGAGMTDTPGPGSALDAWLPDHPEFKIDERMGARYLRSQHSYVRRMKV